MANGPLTLNLGNNLLWWATFSTKKIYGNGFLCFVLDEWLYCCTYYKKILYQIDITQIWLTHSMVEEKWKCLVNAVNVSVTLSWIPISYRYLDWNDITLFDVPHSILISIDRNLVIHMSLAYILLANNCFLPIVIFD